VQKGETNMASSKKRGLISLSADAMPVICVNAADCLSMFDEKLLTAITVIFMPDKSLTS
jgi:hypothetical protein